MNVLLLVPRMLTMLFGRFVLWLSRGYHLCRDLQHPRINTSGRAWYYDRGGDEP